MRACLRVEISGVKAKVSSSVVQENLDLLQDLIEREKVCTCLLLVDE